MIRVVSEAFGNVRLGEFSSVFGSIVSGPFANVRLRLRQFSSLSSEAYTNILWQEA